MIVTNLKTARTSDAFVFRAGRKIGNTVARWPAHFRRIWYRIKYGVPAGSFFLEISPRDVVYADIDEYGNRGIETRPTSEMVARVIDGDWDLIRSPLEEWHIFKGLRAFLIEGKDLKETSYYNDGSGRNRYISDRIWFCITERNFEKERDRNRRIFDTLKNGGFRSQREMGSPDILDEVCVKIGRRGELLFDNSIHRMVISKLLDLPLIPAVVTVRHARWDELRRELWWEARRVSKRSADPVEVYPHPDLQEIPVTPVGWKRFRQAVSQSGVSRREPLGRATGKALLPEETPI